MSCLFYLVSKSFFLVQNGSLKLHNFFLGFYTTNSTSYNLVIIIVQSSYSFATEIKIKFLNNKI